MTNTESPSGVGFDRIASWDEPDDFELDEQSITEDDIQELAAYGLDSEKQTLVGLGPVERARRSRRTAEIPESEPVPPSEQPGPFVADDDEPVPSFRQPKLSAWAVALPALLIVLVVAALALPGPTPTPAVTHAASASDALQPTNVPAPQPESASPPAAQAASQPVEAPAATPPELSAEAASPSVASAASASVAAPPLPVKLPDVLPPSVVDLTNGTDPTASTIDVTSTPPANVLIDGRPIGKAPRLVRVPAGVHSVMFIHPLYGRQSLSVNVVPGVSARASANF